MGRQLSTNGSKGRTGEAILLWQTNLYDLAPGSTEKKKNGNGCGASITPEGSMSDRSTENVTSHLD